MFLQNLTKQNTLHSSLSFFFGRHDDEGEGSILFLSLDHSDEGHHCAKVDYDDCMYSSLERIMVEEHGCVAPYIRSNKAIISSEIFS